MCKALGNVAIQDIDSALSQLVRKQEVTERDARINELIWEKEELNERLRKTERELKMEQSKTQGAHRLIALLEEHVRNPGDLVTKARVYDEAVAKTGGVTALKLIHICVDYSARMETILAEMRILFDNRNRLFRGSPIPLEKIPDLTDFPDLPPADLLHNLQTSTTLRTTRDSAESGGRPTPGSDARTSEAERPQQESPAPIQQPEAAPVPKPTATPVSELTSTPVPDPLPTPEAQDSGPNGYDRTTPARHQFRTRCPASAHQPTCGIGPETKGSAFGFYAPIGRRSAEVHGDRKKAGGLHSYYRVSGALKPRARSGV